MGDFTGFNPTKAIADLRKFESAITKTFFEAKEQFEFYNSTLRQYWASPKALEYNNDMIVAPSELGKEISTLAEKIISSATEAIKGVAKSQDSDFNYSIPKVSTWDYNLLADSLSDGNIGMMINQAGDLVDHYISTLEKTKAKIESLPTDLALYDKDNNLKQLFSDLIKKSSEKINDIIDKISRSINEVKETQRKVLEDATSSAENELSSSNNLSTESSTSISSTYNNDSLKQKENDFMNKMNSFRNLINNKGE